MTVHDPPESTFTRPYHEEVAMAFSAIDCVLNHEKAVYCSCELTTGKRLYKALADHGLKTAAELKQKMGAAWFDEHIFKANAHAASEFAKDVRKSLKDKTLIVTPAPFTAKGWSQPEYLGFWETLIRTRIKAVWFNLNWEFSNGCTFELAVACEAGVSIFNHVGVKLQPTEAIESIQSAIAKLSADSFDAAKLRENLARLRAAVRPGTV